MKGKSIIVTAAIIGCLAGCDMRSGTAREEMDKFSGTPTPVPSVVATPAQTPVPPDAIAQVDTNADGDILTVNDERQKSLECRKYDQVMINSDASKISIKGACRKVVVNGDRNQITADAASEFAFNGSGNTVTYSRFVNGKQPMVTQNQADNTISFVAAAGGRTKK